MKVRFFTDGSLLDIWEIVGCPGLGLTSLSLTEFNGTLLKSYSFQELRIPTRFNLSKLDLVRLVGIFGLGFDLGVWVKIFLVGFTAQGRKLKGLGSLGRSQSGLSSRWSLGIQAISIFSLFCPFCRHSALIFCSKMDILILTDLIEIFTEKLRVKVQVVRNFRA